MSDEIDPVAKRQFDAMQAGAAAASNLKFGDHFRGAFGDAEAAGYGPDSPERSMFTHGYIKVLNQRFPDGVALDASGNIVPGRVTPREVEAFRRALEGMLREHHEKARNAGDPPSVEMMQGPRYVRIVTVGAAERSAYGFIDLTNGNLLKADGWKAPAKHARGNIRGENPLSGCTPYGMAYLAR